MTDKKLIAVFGATGNQGGSVLQALSNSGNYKIKAITRNMHSDKSKKLKMKYDCEVVEANLDDPSSIDSALQDCYGVFLVTDFAAHLAFKEIQQGKNAIDSAIKNGVKHFVFSGLEDVKSVIGKPCNHFDFKAEIEKYGLEMEDKIYFTSVRLPFYFENFQAMVLTKIGENDFVLNVPMGDNKLYSNSVQDIGEIVLTVFENPQEYKSKILNIASEYRTIAEYAEIMSKHLAPKKFSDGKISLEDYSKFRFPGVKDLTVMFEYYQTGKMFRDIELSKKLNKNLLSFEDWVIKNKERLMKEID
jgi:uncharacterized protein YbjT (DUF2867 family)